MKTWAWIKEPKVLTAVKILLAVIFAGACVHEPFIDPAFPGEEETVIPGCVSDGDVCFESSVLPIFVSTCAITGCHDAGTQEEELVLDNYNNIVRKGIVAGNASESKLYKVLFEDGEDQMPPDAPLSKAQKDSIAAWINQGAKNTTNCNCYCDTTQYTYAAIIQPVLSNNCAGCHKAPAPGGGIDLSTFALVKAQVDNGTLVGSITHASGFIPMPQGGKLSDCEITQIRRWVDGGAPNN
ncbi:MAG: c-type cytochrome [Chryseosolibacter sp.]